MKNKRRPRESARMARAERVRKMFRLHDEGKSDEGKSDEEIADAIGAGAVVFMRPGEVGLEELPRELARWRGIAKKDCATLPVEIMLATAELERKIADSLWAGKVAALEAELAKVKGNKAGYRKWKRKEKADVKGARLLEVYSLVYRGGMSVPQVAALMGVTSRSVERWLAELRKRMGPAAHPLTPGRRRSVIADRRVGIDEAQRRALGGGRRGRGGEE